MVNTRTRRLIRAAMSITTIPSFWKLVEMASESPKVVSAQESTSCGVEVSKSGKCTNLYQDTVYCPESQSRPAVCRLRRPSIDHFQRKLDLPRSPRRAA